KAVMNEEQIGAGRNRIVDRALTRVDRRGDFRDIVVAVDLNAVHCIGIVRSLRDAQQVIEVLRHLRECRHAQCALVESTNSIRGGCNRPSRIAWRVASRRACSAGVMSDLSAGLMTSLVTSEPVPKYRIPGLNVRAFTCRDIVS